ncbi:MAG: hypothetical protein IKO72_06520 [Kiritimatiellae bacterium]|nr:hypothetical protein [Kiritimatiellia bacterium]
MNRFLADCLYVGRRIRARLRCRRFDHVVMAGYNCELAFRFLKCMGFLDSTLFCWTALQGEHGFAEFCEHIDDLVAGDIQPPHDGIPMFRCAKTGLWMHGRAHAQAWKGDVSPEFVKAETDEVRSRMLYLREKTLRYLRDDMSVLVVHKANPRFCGPGKADGSVMEVRAALERLGARNMTFLAVCEESCRRNFPAVHPGYELRTVARFNPDDDAVNPKLGDMRGWRVVFDEFRPRKKLKCKETGFKFDT